MDDLQWMMQSLVTRRMDGSNWMEFYLKLSSAESQWHFLELEGSIDPQKSSMEPNNVGLEGDFPLKGVMLRFHVSC